MSGKFRINPILKKELMVSSRNIKMSMAVMVFNLIFALIVFIIMLVGKDYSMTEYYSSMVSVFPTIGIVESIILCLVIPIITSGSISGERERQTLDILLTTPVKPFSIACGKLMASLALVMMYVISGMPLISMAFIFGGMKWSNIFGYIGMMLYLGIYMGAVGINASSKRKSSVSATISSLVTVLAIIFVTGILFFCDYWIGYGRTYFSYGSGQYTVGALTVILVLNPIAPIIEYFMQARTGFGLYQILKNMYWDAIIPEFVRVVFENILVISLLVNVAVSLVFLKVASVRMVVTKNKRKLKNKG